MDMTASRQKPKVANSILPYSAENIVKMIVMSAALRWAQISSAGLYEMLFLRYLYDMAYT